MRQFKEWYFLGESKQVIVGMGYPEIISKLLYEVFAKNTVLIAKWYKEYSAYGSNLESPDWWRLTKWRSNGESIYELTYMYDATKDVNSYEIAAEKMGIDTSRSIIDDDHLEEERGHLYKQIKDLLFKDTFFSYYSIIQDIMNGKLTDIAPYKKLPFREAQKKYDSKRIFEDTKPIKVYPNGFKWINVGRKSSLLADMMRNCGSVGLMSLDPDASILALFGPNNTPHVMVTYSKKDKKISGDQGMASTGVKEKYHDYVLDICKFLGANLDADNSKSKLLGIKYIMGSRLQNIEQIGDTNNQYYEYYKMQVGGKFYYTNGYTVVSEQDVTRVQAMIKSGEAHLGFQGKDIIQTVLARANIETLHSLGILYTSLKQFATGSPIHA